MSDTAQTIMHHIARIAKGAGVRLDGDSLAEMRGAFECIDDTIESLRKEVRELRRQVQAPPAAPVRLSAEGRFNYGRYEAFLSCGHFHIEYMAGGDEERLVEMTIDEAQSFHEWLGTKLQNN